MTERVSNDVETYTCAWCGGVFEKNDGWTDADAKAEALANGFTGADGPMDVVCDVCYRRLLERPASEQRRHRLRLRRATNHRLGRVAVELAHQLDAEDFYASACWLVKQRDDARRERDELKADHGEYLMGLSDEDFEAFIESMREARQLCKMRRAARAAEKGG